ncbi:MAG: Lrp/AsnC family transcriptional regulator [Candidatus Diapherotrites archaeon]
MEKLDSLDQKILGALFEDSRQPLTVLSRKLHISRERLHYRIKVLEEKKVICNYLLTVNPVSFGKKQYAVFATYNKWTKIEEHNLIEKLRHHPSISWFGLLAGKWSLTFDVYARDEKERDNIISKLFDSTKNLVTDYSVFHLIEQNFWFEKLLGIFPKKSNEKGSNPVVLDSINCKLLQLLNSNARIRLVELSKCTNLSPTAVMKRLRYLRKQQVIERFTIAVDYRFWKKNWFGIQVKQKINNKIIDKEINNFLYSHKDVIFFYKYESKNLHSLDIGIMVDDSAVLRNFLNELRGRFPNEIDVKDVFTVLEEVTSHRLPSAVFTAF